MQTYDAWLRQKNRIRERAERSSSYVRPAKLTMEQKSIPWLTGLSVRAKGVILQSGLQSIDALRTAYANNKSVFYRITNCGKLTEKEIIEWLK